MSSTHTRSCLTSRSALGTMRTRRTFCVAARAKARERISTRAT
jgi:hypothetical protein